MVLQICPQLLEFLKSRFKFQEISPEPQILTEAFVSFMVVVASPNISDDCSSTVLDFVFEFKLLQKEVCLLLFVVVVDEGAETDDDDGDDDDSPNTEGEGDESAGQCLRVIVTVADGCHCYHDPPETVDVRVEAVRTQNEADWPNEREGTVRKF